MKRFLLVFSMVLAFVFSAKAQTTYSFEGSMDGWTTIDADGDGFDWQLASILMSGYVIPAHEGTDCISSESYDGTAGPLTPDNYLISPYKAAYTSVSFWACAQDASYPAEHFGVAVSTGDATASEFTLVQEWTLTAKGMGQPTNLTRSGSRESGNWYEYTVDLSAFLGQDVWVAIRHFGCTDQFYLDVDDITLDEGSASTPTAGFYIGFETGDIHEFPFNNGSEYPWIITSEGAYDGTYCMKNGNSGIDNSESRIEATVEYLAPGQIAFSAKCEGEGSSWDVCRFFIDGEEQFAYGNQVTGWNDYAYPVSAGTHTFAWSYTKDGSLSSDEDCFMVDEMVFIGAAPLVGYMATSFEEDLFETFLFDNNSEYPWEMTSEDASDGVYSIKSTNSGIADSESVISVVMNYVKAGRVTFDALCMGEGTENIWDKCIFMIDGDQMFEYGANVSGWNNYEYNVSAGMHTFTWKYTKDSSVNPDGDYFMIDNLRFIANDEVEETIASSSTVVVYPNPASENLMIVSEAMVSEYSIYSVTGAVIMSQKVNAESFTVNVGNLPAGAYLIQMQSANGVQTERFIKK